MTSALPPGWTRLPANTLIAPARPAAGATMRMYDKPTCAASIAALSAATTARDDSTSVWLVSTAPCEMKFCLKRSWLRASWRSASASAAWSFASCALARVTLTSSLRESSAKSGWPALTNWPSLICTLVIVLDTCGRTSTLLSDETVPVASSITSTSRFWTATVVTLTGGPPPAPDADEAGPAAALGPLLPLGRISA